jgi:hypothetical protein
LHLNVVLEKEFSVSGQIDTFHWVFMLHC